MDYSAPLGVSALFYPEAGESKSVSVMTSTKLPLPPCFLNDASRMMHGLGGRGVKINRNPQVPSTELSSMFYQELLTGFRPEGNHSLSVAAVVHSVNHPVTHVETKETEQMQSVIFIKQLQHGTM